MIRKIIGIAVLLHIIAVSAQQTRRVLFLGNSYTHVNNLPQMVANAAASVGKNLIYDMHAPGGYYIAQHVLNPTSLDKIAAGNWDNVVLQDQSLSMAYPGYFMNAFPASIAMDSIVKSHNPCAQTMFFATWGRKNGGTHLCGEPYCDPPEWITRDYFQMDADIESHYHFFADSLKSSVAPVGAVWRYVRQNHPGIELFDADESHPSLAGSYAAACCFYATIFRSDPALINYDGGLAAEQATLIRNAAKFVVYDHLLQWNVGLHDDLLGESCAVLNVPQKERRGWKIFPNPVETVLRFDLPEDSIGNTIAIYNSMGILVRSIAVLHSSFGIDVSDLPSGLYAVVVGDFASSSKLVKK